MQQPDDEAQPQQPAAPTDRVSDVSHSDAAQAAAAHTTGSASRPHSDAPPDQASGAQRASHSKSNAQPNSASHSHIDERPNSAPPPRTTNQDAPRARTHSIGGKVGRKKWTPAHITQMLNVVTTHLPVGAEQWERAATAFNSSVDKAFMRTGQQMKDKFLTLCRLKGETGNPHTLASAVRARAIEERIEQHFSITGSGDPFASTMRRSNSPSESQSHLIPEATDDIPGEMDIDQFINARGDAHNNHDASPTQPNDESAIAAASTSLDATPHPMSAVHQLMSASSSASESQGVRTGKRKRVQLETIVQDVMERDNKKHDSIGQAVAMMATVMATLAASSQQAERRHEEAQRRHEELLAHMMLQQHKKD
jgi:hypothetical protein